MTQKLSNTDRYSATPDQIIAMMSDAGYLTAKYEALGDIKFNVDRQDASDGSLNLKISRTLGSNLPDLAKKVLGAQNDLIQTEAWSTGGAEKSCDFTIESPGKPVKISGTMQIVSAGDGECDYTTNFEIKARVPLIGGKIEKMLLAETQENLATEKDFNDKWLSKG